MLDIKSATYARNAGQLEELIVLGLAMGLDLKPSIKGLKKLKAALASSGGPGGGDAAADASSSGGAALGHGPDDSKPATVSMSVQEVDVDRLDFGGPMPDALAPANTGLRPYNKSLGPLCHTPLETLTRKEKLDYFALHRNCDHMHMCGAQLPGFNDIPQAVVQHKSYVAVFDEYIRYTHMAMVERLPSGMLVAAWQAAPFPEGTNTSAMGSTERLGVEGLDQQHLMMAFSKDALGTAWWPPFKLDHIHGGAALWGPVLHLANSGTLWLFYSESKGCRRAPTPDAPQTDTQLWVPGGDIKVTTAPVRDLPPLPAHGTAHSPPPPLDWSPARTIHQQEDEGGVPKVVSNRLAVLEVFSPTWLLPYWREMPRAAEPADTCLTGALEGSGVLISHDEGLTWRTSEIITDPRTTLIEGTLAELNNGSVLMMFRTLSGCIFSSLSHDGGYTWTRPEILSLPNPNSKMHLLRLAPHGQLLLVFNNHRPSGQYMGIDKCRGCRTRLHMALSRDDGETWERIGRIDEEVSTHSIRIHYPSAVQLADPNMAVIVFSRFYLSPRMGLVSPEQGVVAVSVNLTLPIAGKQPPPPPPPPWRKPKKGARHEAAPAVASKGSHAADGHGKYGSGIHPLNSAGQGRKGSHGHSGTGVPAVHPPPISTAQVDVVEVSSSVSNVPGSSGRDVVDKGDGAGGSISVLDEAAPGSNVVASGDLVEDSGQKGDVLQDDPDDVVQDGPEETPVMDESAQSGESAPVDESPLYIGEGAENVTQSEDGGWEKETPGTGLDDEDGHTASLGEDDVNTSEAVIADAAIDSTASRPMAVGWEETVGVGLITDQEGEEEAEGFAEPE
eukprot:jgi/Mesvir1/2155/Mv16670-RA.1